MEECDMIKRRVKTTEQRKLSSQTSLASEIHFYHKSIERKVLKTFQ